MNKDFEMISFETTGKSPSDYGLYMPAEWAHHAGCWMQWPCRTGFRSKATKKSYALVAKTISEFEPVAMAVDPSDLVDAKSYLGNNVEYVEMPLDDGWARDSGPNFLIDDKGNVAGSTFTFNCWGENYEPWDSDAEAGGNMLVHAGVSNFRSSLTAEGGGVTIDGQGTIITTESCFLNTNRNPGWTRAEVEVELCRVLGGKKVVWLPGNVDEKETNGHVDGIAAFVRPGVVLLETAFDSAHPCFHNLKENKRALELQTDVNGKPFDIAFIEDAWGAENEDEERFCISYINAYLPNGGVVMPKYNLPADVRARKVYEKLYPERQIRQINIDDIAVGGGGIHCITQQQPSGK